MVDKFMIEHSGLILRSVKLVALIQNMFGYEICETEFSRRNFEKIQSFAKQKLDFALWPKKSFSGDPSTRVPNAKRAKAMSAKL